MKILSKFTDYYDYSCGYNSFETTYDRKLINEENVDFLNKTLSVFNKSLPNSNYRNRGDNEEYFYTYGYIVVANVAYPFIKIIKNEWINYSWKKIVDKYFYEFNEELKTFFDQYTHKYIEDFFKNIPLFNFKYPIALIQTKSIDIDNSLADNTDYKFNNKKLIYNIRLKDYKFPIDGRFVLQEIEVFLNKEKDELKDIIKDDKILLHAKGFDSNSFKHMKNT